MSCIDPKFKKTIFKKYSKITLVQNKKSQLSEYVYPQRVIGGFPLKDCWNDRGKGVIPRIKFGTSSEIFNQESKVVD